MQRERIVVGVLPGPIVSRGRRDSLWDPVTQNLIEDLTPGGVSQATHTHEMGMDELLVTQGPEGRRAFLRDTLNSVRGLADEIGTKVNSYSYEAFGSPRSEVEGSPNRFRFTGREWDAETGEQYHRWRNYNPDTSRWTQADPVGHFGGINLYQYGMNNPGVLRDPSGLNPLIPALIMWQLRLMAAIWIEQALAAVGKAWTYCQSVQTPGTSVFFSLNNVIPIEGWGVIVHKRIKRRIQLPCGNEMINSECDLEFSFPSNLEFTPIDVGGPH